MDEGSDGNGRTAGDDPGADGEPSRADQGKNDDGGTPASHHGDAAGAPGGDGGDDVDQALRSIIEGSAGEARFREPSAKERGNLARQAREKQRNDARQFAKLEKETRKQAGKLRKNSLKGQRKVRRRGRLRRAARGTAWGVSVAILVAAGVFAYSRSGHSAAGSGGLIDPQTVTNGALPPSTKPVSPLTGSGPPADPFSGSPAGKWADGTSGIVLPAAKPIGQYPASKVKFAYQTTKNLLVAAALDKQTLNGGAPTAFANLLSQDQRTEFVSQLDKIGVGKAGDPLSSRSWIMQFAPGTAKLIGSVIKVRGSMSAVVTKSGGYPILRVNVNYLVAYAIKPPKAPASWMRIVSHFYGTVDFGDWQDADTPFEPWWDAGPAAAGAMCGSRDGFQHPAYPEGVQGGVAPSGPPINPYSLATPSTDGVCHSTTGT